MLLALARHNVSPDLGFPLLPRRKLQSLVATVTSEHSVKDCWVGVRLNASCCGRWSVELDIAYVHAFTERILNRTSATTVVPDRTSYLVADLAHKGTCIEI